MATYNPDADLEMYRNLSHAIATLTEQLDDIKHRLRLHYGAGKHTADDGTTITVTANRRFDPELVWDVLSPQQVAEIQELTVSATLAKKLLPPAVYQQCTKEVGQPRLTISSPK